MKTKEKVEYFTDEMLQNMFVFPDKLTSGKFYGSKPIRNTVKIHNPLKGKIKVK